MQRKWGKPKSFRKKIIFLFNRQKININEEKELISVGLVDKAKIIVYLSRNMKIDNI